MDRRVPALDGLRGCAVLAVIAYHFFGLNATEPAHALDRAAYALVGAGWSGVDLFFVLSGFLITGILYDTRAHADYFRTFYLRRVLRIFPLYYGFLLGVLVVLPLLSPFHAAAVDRTTELSLWSYLFNLRVAFGGWEVAPTHLVPFWTLAIEEQFYLVWPFLVFTLSRRAMLRVCGGLVLGSLLLRVGLHGAGLTEAAEGLTPARLDGLAMGAALALATRDPADARRLARWVRPVLWGAPVALVGMRVWRGGFATTDPVVGTVGLTLLSLLFAALLLRALEAAPSAPLGRLLESRSLTFFGRYSYALYVFHQLVGMTLLGMGISAATLSPLPGTALPGQLAFLVVGTAASVGAALLSWHLYEKHFLRLKERFSYEPRPAPTVAVAAVPPA